MKTTWSIISFTKWNLGNTTLCWPLQQTYLQTYKEICLRANGAKEGTRKYNYTLNLQAWSLHFSLSQPHLQPKSRKARRFAGACEREGRTQRGSGLVLTMVNHSKWLTYLGWGGHGWQCLVYMLVCPGRSTTSTSLHCLRVNVLGLLIVWFTLRCTMVRSTICTLMYWNIAKSHTWGNCLHSNLFTYPKCTII